MAAVLILCTAATYWSGLRVISLRRQSMAHHDAVAQMERLLSTVKDVETGQRGFVITGDESYLEPYERARPQVQVEIDHLRRLKKTGVARSDIDLIEELSRKKLNEVGETIALRRTNGFEGAAARVRAGAGKAAMDQLREKISALRDEQESQIQAEGDQIDAATWLRTLVFASCGLLNLFFIVWAYRRIRVAVNEREAAYAAAKKEHREVVHQKDLLAVTLASIGDCVIVTDAAGHITFMNGVAQKLTGWKLEEAERRPVSDIFRIINEESRVPVESPVDKVLREGVTVGLANHTVLIRKDGSEVPIDDSGAPIRETDGAIRGVILVFRDFSEHKAAEHALHQAKEIAETANAAKDKFLAMLSHELRTPLTPVLATLNLWEASEDVPAEMKPGVQMLRRSVELEARIIDDLLDVTRIAKGILTFTREVVDAHETIDFLVGICHSEFAGKHLGLSVHLRAQKHHVFIDAGRLQQVLWNVIKNAGKFTESGGEVRIETANDGGNVVISVIDNGIGMTPDTLHRLFKPFEQGEEGRTHRSGGLGLGMAISSALIGQLGGELTASSDGPGEGSTFTITFPSTNEAPVENIFNGESGRTLAGSRILLVEDHLDSARALTQLLGKKGYAVTSAHTVASALETITQEDFHLLICDIGLPDATGFDFIETVRKTNAIPAIALSGFGMEQDVSQSELSGFDFHLTKPVNFQNLERAIRKLLSKPSPVAKQ